MGIGAHKKWLSADWQDDMSNHAHIPPGYFWCEWFNGEHYSIDYKRVNDKWIPLNACQGFYKTEDNLTKFDYWRLIEPPAIELPDWVHDIEVVELNIEFKGDKITEIHLRSGNDINLVGEIGDEIYPIWQGDDYSHLEHLKFIPNLSEDDEDFGDEFESLYKGEISKSGAPILPSKRARKVPEKIQVSKEDLAELQNSDAPTQSENISSEPQENETGEVSLDEIAENDSKTEENSDTSEQ